MSETLKTEVDEITGAFRNLTPERIMEMNAEAAANKVSADAAVITRLTADAKLPTRHTSCQVVVDGQWGEKFTTLKAKLGTGFIIGLVGTRGNGKTQMAVSLAMDSIRSKRRSARYTTATAFFMRIKGTYGKDADEKEGEVVDDFARPRLLVVDEAGKRGGSEWENNLLFELLNRRYNDMKDTILVDNRTLSEFVETIGPSLASRMNEGGGIVDCNWESFRK